MDFTIKNAFQGNLNGRDIIIFQDSTKMAMIIHPKKEEMFTLTDLEDYLTINVDAHDGGRTFKKDFRITYPIAMADHLVYSLGREDVKVEYNEEADLGILKFSAGAPEWQLLISGSISGSDEEETMPTIAPNTTVTIAEDNQ